jgi:hypothetical protein
MSSDGCGRAAAIEDGAAAAAVGAELQRGKKGGARDGEASVTAAVSATTRARRSWEA